MQTSYRKPATRQPLSLAEQLQAAIARVQKGLQEGKDYRVAGQGKRLDTGEQFYCVPSDSEKLRGLWHVITVKADGLDCDCFYSREKHQICSHRATVYLFLKAKAAAEKAGQAKAQPAAQPAPKVAHTKENALPYDSGEGFSIFKTERRYQTPDDAAAARDGAPASDYYQHAYR